MSELHSALAFAGAHRRRFVSDLGQLLRFPTVSARPEHADDLNRCARWLVDHLRAIGMSRAILIPTQDYPLVHAEWCRAPARPTLLIYGHYDVQPVDPVQAWHSPPFQPTIRGMNLVARGASDNKGQLLIHVKAIESYLRTAGRLPLNVRCLFDGEEEVGSPNLMCWLAACGNELSADVALVSDTRIRAPNRPAITHALRGALSLELEVRGPRHDLHSGSFGGAVHNPIQALCEIVAGLHDAEGRVAIPGFYDRVRRVTANQRAYMKRVGRTDAQILGDAGVPRAAGEAEYTLYERTTIRPTLTINGITGGYQGPGNKSVIPARASAKLNFRLVPDQDPREVEQLLRRHIARIAPPTVRALVHSTRLAAQPVQIDRCHPALKAAASAYHQAFGRAAVLLRSGGTIPIVSTLQTRFGLPTVMMGFALPNDNMHAPNEKFYLPNFYKGIQTSIWFLHNLSTLRPLAFQLQRARVGRSRRSAVAPDKCIEAAELRVNACRLGRF